MSSIATPTRIQRRPDIATRRPAVTDRLLESMTQRIVREFHPFAVILFGSHAWGKPHKESDIDLLVVMDYDGGKAEQRGSIARVARVDRLPMDLMLYTPEELATRISMRDFFILRILENGRALYLQGQPWRGIEAHPTMTILQEWVNKAEAGYRMAVAINRQRKHPIPDGVVFHCQQCVEKYLKALLIYQNASPAKTHDLVKLMQECEPIDPSLSALEPEISYPDQFSVDPRYPGFSATIQDAASALETTRRVRITLRKLLGL